MFSSNPGFQNRDRILGFDWAEGLESIIIVTENQLWGWQYLQWNSQEYYQSAQNDSFLGFFLFGGGRTPRIDQKWSYSQTIHAETFLKIQSGNTPLTVQSFEGGLSTQLTPESWRLDYDGNLSALAWDRDVDLLLVGTDKGIIYQWNEDFTEYTQMASGFAPIQSMTISPDNQLLAIEVQNNDSYGLIVIDRNDYVNRTSVDLKTSLKYLQWTGQANQQQLVYHENNSREINIVALDQSDQNLWNYRFINHNSNILAVSFENSNRYLALENGSIIRRTKVQDDLFEITMSYSPVNQTTALAVSPDGTMFVHNEGQSLIVRDLESFDVLYRIDDKVIEIYRTDYLEIEIAFPLISIIVLLPILVLDQLRQLRTKRSMRNTIKYSQKTSKTDMLYPKEEN